MVWQRERDRGRDDGRCYSVQTIVHTYASDWTWFDISHWVKHEIIASPVQWFSAIWIRRKYLMSYSRLYMKRDQLNGNTWKECTRERKITNVVKYFLTQKFISHCQIVKLTPVCLFLSFSRIFFRSLVQIWFPLSHNTQKLQNGFNNLSDRITYETMHTYVHNTRYKDICKITAAYVVCTRCEWVLSVWVSVCLCSVHNDRQHNSHETSALEMLSKWTECKPIRICYRESRILLAKRRTVNGDEEWLKRDVQGFCALGEMKTISIQFRHWVAFRVNSHKCALNWRNPLPIGTNRQNSKWIADVIKWAISLFSIKTQNMLLTISIR